MVKVDFKRMSFSSMVGMIVREDIRSCLVVEA